MSEENKAKASITVKGVEYDLRLTVGFWKQAKELCGVNQENLLVKINSEFGDIMPKLLRIAAYWGMKEKPENGLEGMPFSIEDIENELDQSCMDAFEQAVFNGMTNAQKRVLELAKKKVEKDYEEAEAEIAGGKKKD